jgi:hypothetical protein
MTDDEKQIEDEIKAVLTQIEGSFPGNRSLLWLGLLA